MNLRPTDGWPAIGLPNLKRSVVDFNLQTPAILSIGGALGGLIAFYELQNRLPLLGSRRPEYIAPVLIAALVGAVIFSRVGYQDLPLAFTALARTTAAGILVALVFEPPSSALADPTFAGLARFMDWGYWVALAIATLSNWRPSFLYPAALYLIMTRYAAGHIAGYEETLDILYMTDMAQFLSLSACGIALLRFFQARAGAPKILKVLALDGLRQLALCLAFIAIGFHLGNYFWSGWAKLMLGPHPWSWAFLNHTQNMMLVALKMEFLVYGQWPWLTQHLFDGFGAIVVISNIAVIVTQLFALIAPLRLRWLAISTWFYDALHVGIFFIAGLFFWPWIWNNFSIMFAVRRSTDREIGWAPKACCIVTVLLGGVIGNSVGLAWWDVTDFKIATIQAEAEDGNWVDVPLSFFLS